MCYEGSLGISVSPEIAELKKRLDVLEMKANGKCWSTRASDWMIQTDTGFSYLITFPVTF